MKKILVCRADGSVGIIIPSNEATTELIERDALAVPDYVSHTEVDDARIPSSREFRNAWRHSNENISICCDSAKEIALSTVRINRQKKFEELGVPQRLSPALEKAILPQETQARLQSLRDITNPLKDMQLSGVFDDESILDKLRTYLTDIVFDSMAG